MNIDRLFEIGFLVMFGACLNFAPSDFYAAENATQASAPTKTKAFVTEPIDMNTSMLGPNFAGNDPEAVYNALAALKNESKKGEFETTAQYQQRVYAASKAALIANLKLTSIYAFRVDPDTPLAKYDADTQQMTVTIRSETVATGTASSQDDNYSGTSFDHSREEVLVKRVYRGERTYTGTNGFGAVAQVTSSASDFYEVAFLKLHEYDGGAAIPETFSLKLDAKPEAAITLKPNIAVLALVSLDPNSSYTADFTNTSSATVQNPYSYTNSSRLIFCKLVDLWVFDQRDGTILARLSDSESKAKEAARTELIKRVNEVLEKERNVLQVLNSLTSLKPKRSGRIIPPEDCTLIASLTADLNDLTTLMNNSSAGSLPQPMAQQLITYNNEIAAGYAQMNAKNFTCPGMAW